MAYTNKQFKDYNDWSSYRAGLLSDGWSVTSWVNLVEVLEHPDKPKMVCDHSRYYRTLFYTWESFTDSRRLGGGI